ncbi:MAG TPA: hypothetical protein VN673_00960, partial [Clostridia bacterium]|nr:hypothetical protein [Clostridia bacterium]
HKAAGERALAYLMRRDTDADGLVEMMNQSHADQRGSDWIDIIWAAHENALVNAEFYHALMRWTELETILGDTNRAVEYATFAGRLKASFNQTVDEGGFWDPQNGWYTYWRDKDGSIHGNNLVTPVNFAAISYGLCDVPARRDSLLSKIESLMQKEGLFFWPLNFFPFPREEGHANNFPYPNYENGDIFLSWGELATRAYAQVDAGIALKYVKNVLAKYEIDGLSHQRYQRQSQIGIGEDILAGNCMTIVGLYRNIYGIQPKHNRLYLEPHLPAELNGTRLNYPLRGQRYEIELSAGAFAMTANGCTIRYHQPFAINTVDDGVEFFPGSASCPGLVARPSRSAAVEVTIHAWPVQSDKPRIWQLASPQGNSVTASICNLLPGADYVIECNGKLLRRLRADAAGAVTCKLQAPRTTDSFVLRLVTGEKRF